MPVRGVASKEKGGGKVDKYMSKISNDPRHGKFSEKNTERG